MAAISLDVRRTRRDVLAFHPHLAEVECKLALLCEFIFSAPGLCKKHADHADTARRRTTFTRLFIVRFDTSWTLRLH